MLSIIIPVLNEDQIIEKLLFHLKENSSGENDIEVITVDGGSTDNTWDLIKDFSKQTSTPEKSQNVKKRISFQLFTSEKGRAKQMNYGAKQASSESLYFLHADSFPPKNYDTFILSEINKGNIAGCFRMKFDSNHWWLKLAGWLTRFKWKGCRGGDQSLFISKKLFNEIGGFDESYIIYEDNVLINELYKRKSFIVIPHSLTTSARRYKEFGIWRLQYHFWAIHLKKWLGANADGLYAYYSKNISKTQ